MEVFVKKNKGRAQAKVKVPVSWRIISILAMLPLGVGIFLLIFTKSDGKFPLGAGDSTDPYFFGFIFAVLIPVIVYAFIVDKVLKGIVTKRSGKAVALDIAEELGKEVAIAAVDAVLGGGSSSDNRSSSGTKGGGGSFGGGGASGGY
ncbi:MAG: hypothetical protein C0402_11150 [Thermodesulfovibrio sp.]|nr:hypothetical protein [Thermodesulfovibrio sp.]